MRISGNERRGDGTTVASLDDLDTSHTRAALLRDVDYEGHLDEIQRSHSQDVSKVSVTKASSFVWILSCSAAQGALLFGYDTGVISATLVNIHSDLGRELTTLDKSLITSVTALTALAASPTAPLIADVLGRKAVIFLTDILFIIGAIWQAFSTSVLSLIFGRAIVGCAVGAAAVVAPIYISELSPATFRGRLVTVYSLFLTGGQVLAYFVGWSFSAKPDGWKWMVGLGAIPAALQTLLLLAAPETPRWLVMVGEPATALKVLNKIYGEEWDANSLRRLVERIETQLTEAPEGSDPLDGRQRSLGRRLSRLTFKFASLFSDGCNRRGLVIACLLQGCQQLSGFNSLMYFSATIFSLLGFSSPTLTSLSIAVTNFIFTVAALFTIDSLGRRRSLLWSIPVMSIALASCAVGFSYTDLGGGSSTSVSSEIPNKVSNLELEPRLWPYLIVISTIVYTAAYAIGLGCVPWQQSELFPLQVRAVGTGIATATNWATNFLVGLTFLPLMEHITATATFSLYTAFCVASWLAIWFLYPETAGLDLEDVSALLDNGWGVEKSMEQWKAYRSSLKSKRPL